MTNPIRSANVTKCHNRLGALMVHTVRYAFRGTSRLAADSGLAKSTVSQLVRGRSRPLYSTVERVVNNLARELDRPLPLREVFSAGGSYPTPYVCTLCGCPGCLPDKAFGEDGALMAATKKTRPGEWTGDVAEFATTPPVLKQRRRVQV